MYDPVQLRTFLTVAQTLSFTQAAGRLGVRQSTVSQHVRRLEEATGRPLFLRDTHSVELTEDGEALLGFARTILEAHERAAAFFTGTRLRGRLRFGASEDFVLTRLPEVLEGFRHEHPEVDLELSVELSGVLHERLDAGRLDLVLAKRRGGRRAGPAGVAGPDGVDRGAGAAGGSGAAGPADRVPAAGDHPGPRAGGPGAGGPGLADRLYERQPERPDRGGPRRSGRDGAHPGLIPPGLVRVGGLPELGPVEFALLQGRRPTPASEALAAAVLSGGDRLSRPA